MQCAAMKCLCISYLHLDQCVYIEGIKRPRIELQSTCPNFVQDSCVLGISCRESPLGDAMHCDEVHCVILPNMRPMRADEIKKPELSLTAHFNILCDTNVTRWQCMLGIRYLIVRNATHQIKCTVTTVMPKFCTWIRPMRIRKIGSHKWATRCIASQKYIILCARWGIKQLARTENHNAMHTCPPFVRDQWQLSSQKLSNV